MRRNTRRTGTRVNATHSGSMLMQMEGISAYCVIDQAGAIATKGGNEV